MDKIFTELSNPVWWFSVVIAGIAINVLSSYLKGALDNFLSRTFSWWRNRSKIRKKEWEERVISLAFNKDERELAITDELRSRIKAILYFGTSFILCCTTGIIFNFPDINLSIKIMVFFMVNIIWLLRYSPVYFCRIYRGRFK